MVQSGAAHSARGGWRTGKYLGRWVELLDGSPGVVVDIPVEHVVCEHQIEARELRVVAGLETLPSDPAAHVLLPRSVAGGR